MKKICAIRRVVPSVNMAVNWRPDFSVISLSDQVCGCYPVTKINTQLVEGLSSVPPLASPLFGYINHGQIRQFEKGIIGREERPILGHFPELPVEVLYRIRGIDQFSDLSRILEVGGKLRPVVVS